MPERYRMGALIRLVGEHLIEHRIERLDTALGTVEMRGCVLALGDAVVTLAPTPLAMTRLLVSARGAVVSRAELARAAGEALDEHAVDVATSPLRRNLPDPELVTTVIKRGYRLTV